MAALAVVLTSGLAGCGIVDSAPTTTSKPAETNVKSYYIALESKDMEYHYATSAQAAYYPSSSELTMHMLGYDSDYYGVPVYSCNWSYSAPGYGTTPWYYAISSDKVVGLGIEYPDGRYSDTWTELQAPLKQDASWTFTSQNEAITATVLKYGVKATVEGKTYDDVVMVDYTGAKGTKGTQWFARDIGTIFSHIERPAAVSGMASVVEERFESRVQK